MAKTEREILAEIERLESIGVFDAHVTPVSYETALPIDNFEYVTRGFWKRLRLFFRTIFIIKPYRYASYLHFHSKVKGRANLKGIRRAIVTCNHINKLDCLVVQHALRRKTFISGADFNNQNTWFGEMMRCGGYFPIGNSFSTMKRFNQAVEYHLNHNRYVMFYPEQAMWWNYTKPRPLKDGAFHYAIKHDVPIIPVFITIRERKKLDREGVACRQYTVNIMPPIYPDKALSRQENNEMLKAKNMQACKEKYEEVYGKPLVYTTKLSETK